MPQPTIRPIQEEDWATILALQAEAYYALEPEDQSVLRSKHRLGPTSCLVACRGSEVIGYCLAIPGQGGNPQACIAVMPNPPERIVSTFTTLWSPLRRREPV